MRTNKNKSESAGRVKKRRLWKIVTWTDEEDDILRDQIINRGNENWNEIASMFKNKTARQCKRRWSIYLNTDFRYGGWTPEEDMLLCEAQRKYGNKWLEIAKVVSGRTDNAVKNRFNTLCKRRAKKEAMDKENDNVVINENNKRATSNSNGSSESASSLKKPRAARRQSSSNNGDKHEALVPQNQANPLKTLVEGNGETEGTFPKKDICAKVFEDKFGESEDNEITDGSMIEEDLKLNLLNALMEELRTEIQSSQRQHDKYDSPISSECSYGSRMSTNASSGQMNQSHKSDKSTSDNMILVRESTNLEEISVPFVEQKIAEDVQITPKFKTLAAAVPSPQFSESERQFLKKTLGIDTPSTSKSAKSPQTRLCGRALVHIL